MRISRLVTDVADDENLKARRVLADPRGAPLPARGGGAAEDVVGCAEAAAEPDALGAPRDAAEMQPRCSRDAAEMCSRDAAEIARDLAEM